MNPMHPGVDDDVARLVRRIREVYPDLAVATVRAITGHGQNNAVLVVDDRLVFRFPRYPDGIARLERETRILRAIRRHVSLATPDPVYSAFAETVVGKVFIGYPLIPGEPLWKETLDAMEDATALRALGEQVGTFLSELHSVPVADVLPEEAAAFDLLATWKGLYARIEARLFPSMRPDARAATASHFKTFFDRSASLAIDPVLVHGDFGTGNILYDPTTSSISGVIDFGSAGVGDPALDCAALPWTPRAFFEGLAAAYPAVASAAERVAFYRGTFALQEALFGIEQGDHEAYRRGIAPFI